MGVPGAWALAGHRASLPQGTWTAARALLGCPCHGAPPLVIHGAETCPGDRARTAKRGTSEAEATEQVQGRRLCLPVFSGLFGRPEHSVPLIHGLAVRLRSCLNIVEPVLTRKWQHLKYLHLTERPPVTLE